MWQERNKSRQADKYIVHEIFAKQLETEPVVCAKAEARVSHESPRRESLPAKREPPRRETRQPILPMLGLQEISGVKKIALRRVFARDFERVFLVLLVGYPQQLGNMLCHALTYQISEPGQTFVPTAVTYKSTIPRLGLSLASLCENAKYNRTHIR